MYTYMSISKTKCKCIYICIHTHIRYYINVYARICNKIYDMCYLGV